MHPVFRHVAITCALMIPLAGAAAEPDSAGVRDAENRWSEAFMTGDSAMLDGLLDEAYVSVSATGEARHKSEILQLARDFAARHPGSHAKPLAPTSTIRDRRCRSRPAPRR